MEWWTSSLGVLSRISQVHETMTYFLIIGAMCYGILYIVMWHFRRRRLYELASKFEGPKGLPFIGNAHLFSGSMEHVLSRLYELNKSYTSPFRLWLAQRLVICINDPEQIKMVCLSPKTLEKSQVLKNLSLPFLGTGIFTAPVPKWKVHRKLIQPTFNAKILDSFVEVFATQSKILTEQMERNLDGPEFEIYNFVSRCTLDMICETAMGVKVRAQTNGNFSYVEAAQGVVASLSKRMFCVWLYPDIIFYSTKLGKEQKKHIELMHGFTDNVIQMRKNELLKCNSQPEKNDNEDDAYESKSRREAFLDHLIKLSYGNENLSDESLRAEVDTMVFAGNETSAIADSQLIFMLASHPEVQEKVYQELYEIYGNHDVERRPVTSKDLPRMKYMERVIKETLRIFPVTPFMIREATDDLNIGNQTIPNGSLIAIGILSLHRNEQYWPDPLKFDPDRFLPNEIAKRHPYSYMAFSAGPRNCIGLNYAMMSMKTLIATVLRKYSLKKDNIVPVKHIRLKGEIVLKPVDPITVRIEKRIRN